MVGAVRERSAGAAVRGPERAAASERAVVVGDDGRHVGFESWLERDHLMLLDFDPAVTAVASQPFWLWWTAADGHGPPHAPDYFARRADGTGIVVDCRPEDRRGAGPGPGCVRGGPGGERGGGVGVPAGRRRGSGAGGERAVAGRLTAIRGTACPAALPGCWKLFAVPAAADGPGGGGGRPAGGAAGAVPPAVAA